MVGSHVEEGGEQVRGKDSGPSTRGRKDKSRDAISSLKGRFVRLKLGMADTKQQESTPKLKCFLCDGLHLTRECPKRKALSTLIEKSEKTMEDARLGSIQMIGALQVMLEAVGQFGLYYSEQTQGILRSLMATLSLLSKVIESQGEDTEISSIRDRLQLDTGDEGWAIHTYGSLRYRGPVVVPQLVELRDEILMEFHCSRF